MSYKNVPQSGSPGWAVAYKVALGVIAVGVLMIVLSPFVGGLLYTQAIHPLIELFLGAPKEPGVVISSEPETGTELLALLGAGNLIAGICMFFARLTLELMRLAGEPSMTRRMTRQGKLTLGTAAPGIVALAVGASSKVLVSVLFEGYESEFIVGIMQALDAIWHTGLLLLVCSLITLFLRGRRLFGWADAVGWAKLRCGWLNRLSVALFVTGVIGAIPFDDVAGIFAITGVAVLALGILPQLLASGRP